MCHIRKSHTNSGSTTTATGKSGINLSHLYSSPISSQNIWDLWILLFDGYSAVYRNVFVLLTLTLNHSFVPFPPLYDFVHFFCQDFEAMTPNLLARTIETVEGGGIAVILLRSMTSLKQLYTMSMDVHSRYRTEAHQDVVGRFNER